MRITEAQRRALAYLATVERAYPAQIGEVLTGGLKRSGFPMKAQGLGRLGGTMGTRLAALGLAYRSLRSYSISDAGRRALEERDREEGW